MRARKVVTYTVHEREDDAGDISQRADNIVFVKEGFSWVALLVPMLWLLYHRMWFVFAALIVLVLSIQGVFLVLDTGDAVAGWAALSVNPVIALLANDLRRWTLASRGYNFDGPVSGRDLTECEERFFTDWLSEQESRADKPSTSAPEVQRPVAAPVSSPKGSVETEGVIGLFPEPGK